LGELIPVVFNKASARQVSTGCGRFACDGWVREPTSLKLTALLCCQAKLIEEYCCAVLIKNEVKYATRTPPCIVYAAGESPIDTVAPPSLLFADCGQVVEEPTFTLSEAEQLFEAYDDENVNFVTIGRIRERCRNNYKLPDAILYNFLLPIEKIADDEMFNRIEFFRMLKPYITVGVCFVCSGDGGRGVISSSPATSSLSPQVDKGSDKLMLH
jgi:hypothetical protein